MVCDSDAQHMQCNGLSTAIRSFRLTVFRGTFAPKPPRNASYFTSPTRLVAQSRSFGSKVLTDAPGRTARLIELETSPALSPAALARAASQTIRVCGKEKQFGDALYILNSMRFSIFSPSPDPPPKPSERPASTQVPKPKRSRLLSSAPSSINGYTFIDFGQPVPTRLASHSFLHTLVKAGLPTKAAAQAQLMMAAGIRIRTKTMESILSSTVDKSSYPPIKPRSPPGTNCLNVLDKYPIADKHTRIAIRLLEEARHRRQERTQQMYDVVINACLLQGEIIVASLLFLMLIKDWQLRQALKNQCANNPPPEPSEPLTASPLHPTRQPYWSLLERIDRTLATRKDPQDPSFQNAIQALANLAFAVDTGRFPSRFMGSLIKTLHSVPKTPAVAYIGPPGEVHPVIAYRYIHQVLMRLVRDAGGKPGVSEWRDGQKYNVHAFSALLHYCLRHRLSKAHASDLLEVMKERWKNITLPSVNVLFRSSTLYRDDSIQLGRGYSLSMVNSASIGSLSPPPAKFPLTRWAHISNTLKLGLAKQYPSEPAIYMPATPDSYAVTGLITHLTATDRGHIVAKKLAEIIPELNLVGKDGSRIPLKERGRHAVLYGPYFFTAVLNALVKGGRTVYARRVWGLAVEAEMASWADGNEPWFLPIHAYTCMLQLHSSGERKAGKPTAPSRGDSGCGGDGQSRGRTNNTKPASAMAMGNRVFRTVQTRCRFLEAVERKHDILSMTPPALRNFAPDGRYFNALLDLYGKRAIRYARPVRNRRSYWRWLEKMTSKRFARSGTTTVHWHPMLEEIIAEMRKYGYKVPEGLRFLLIGRSSGVETGDAQPLQQVRPGPPPKKNPQRIPVLKTRGLPARRRKCRRCVRRGV